MHYIICFRLDSAEQEQIIMQQEKRNLELRMEKDIDEAKVCQVLYCDLTSTL